MDAGHNLVKCVQLARTEHPHAEKKNPASTCCEVAPEDLAPSCRQCSEDVVAPKSRHRPCPGSGLARQRAAGSGQGNGFDRETAYPGLRIPERFTDTPA